MLFTLSRTPGFGSRWDQTDIVVQSAASDERRILVTGGSEARYVPTGHLVYAQGAALYAMPFEVDRLEPTGGRVQAVEGVRRAAVMEIAGGIPNPSAIGAAQYGVAADGTLAYVPGAWTASGLSRLVWVDETGRRDAIDMPPGRYAHPRLSPDGRWLAVERQDGRATDLWLYEVSGTTGERKLTEGGNNRYPVWSRDGEYLVFSRTARAIGDSSGSAPTAPGVSKG